MTTNNLPAPHPGVYLREELEARNWSQKDLSFALGVPEQGINAIVTGKRGISPEMAKLLGDAFDQSPEYWLNLQKMHELAMAPKPDPAISRRARLLEFPVREMIKRGWLTHSEDAELFETQFARFFGASSVDDVPRLRFAAKRTYYDETPPAQLAWMFRVRQIAQATMAPAYSEKSLLAALPRLAALMSAPEEARHVSRILLDCGVRFVVVESLPGARIDGVCLWINDRQSPVIGMSTQRDYIDNFWFGLRHEIEHVLRKHGQDQECIDEKFDAKVATTEEERVANEAAAEFCVPQDQLENFIYRVQPYFSEQRVTLFAQKLGLHPGVVVGQLQNKLDRYDFLKKHQAKVRQYVTSAAITDGWGTVFPVDL